MWQRGLLLLWSAPHQSGVAETETETERERERGEEEEAREREREQEEEEERASALEVSSSLGEASSCLTTASHSGAQSVRS